MFLQCVVDFILKLCKYGWHYSSKCVLTSISEVFSGVSIRRKLVEGSLSGLPQLPWSNQRFLNFLIKLGEPFTWETKNAPGRRVTRLAGSPIYYGRVTLLARLTFFHINFLARPTGSSRSRWDNQSMRERCCQFSTRVKGQTFLFSYKSSSKLTGLGGWPSFLGQLSSIQTEPKLEINKMFSAICSGEIISLFHLQGSDIQRCAIYNACNARQREKRQRHGKEREGWMKIRKRRNMQ